MILTDSHTHLFDPAFNEDLEKVLERAKITNLKYILNCVDASDREEIKKGAGLSEKYDSIFISSGVHPYEAEKWNEDIREILLSFPSNKFLSIGEIGLDPTYEVPLELQKYVFIEQVEIAKKLEIPIIIHCRHSFKEIFAILNALDFPYGGILHTFSGTFEEAKKFIEIGFYISFSGVVTYSKKAKEVVKKVPLERILIETDSPYLAPLPYKGARNEPSYIIRTAEEISKLKEISLEEAANKTTENFISLFLNKSWN
ncbi:MAG: TatD family hydrolase [Candidatus Aminicenantia bacterium]